MAIEPQGHSKTTVVHCKKRKYDVYIGRSANMDDSIWGNPFTHIKTKKTRAEFIVDSREEAIEKCREYFLSRQDLLDKLPELIGKRLGCWCAPDKDCHGRILLDLIQERFGGTRINRFMLVEKIEEFKQTEINFPEDE
jgi:hypothetical protein